MCRRFDPGPAHFARSSGNHVILVHASGARFVGITTFEMGPERVGIAARTFRHSLKLWSTVNIDNRPPIGRLNYRQPAPKGKAMSILCGRGTDRTYLRRE